MSSMSQQHGRISQRHFQTLGVSFFCQMNISINRFFESLFVIFLNGRTQPFLAYFLTSFLFQNFIPLQIHLNKPMFLKSPYLDQSFEYFDATEECDFIEGKIDVLNLDQI